MSDSRKPENLKTMNLPQLEEILQRENALLANTRVIEKLPDKGESIRKFRDRVEKEIRYRNQLQELEEVVNRMTITDADKHVQKLYDIEKTPETERYKPFATLNKVKEIQPEKKVHTVMEDCSHCSKMTKLIPLPESLGILKKQDERTKEEQMKASHSRILEKLKKEENEGNEKESGSSSSEDYSEPELGEGNG